MPPMLELLIVFIRYAPELAGYLQQMVQFADTIASLCLNVTLVMIAWGILRDRSATRR